MGSFIITLKTINRAGIHTRSRGSAPEQGSSPLHSQHQVHQGSSCRHCPRNARIPQAAAAASGKGLLQTQGRFKSTT